MDMMAQRPELGTCCKCGKEAYVAKLSSSSSTDGLTVDCLIDLTGGAESGSDRADRMCAGCMREKHRYMWLSDAKPPHRFCEVVQNGVVCGSGDVCSMGVINDKIIVVPTVNGKFVCHNHAMAVMRSWGKALLNMWDEFESTTKHLN